MCKQPFLPTDSSSHWNQETIFSNDDKTLQLMNLGAHVSHMRFSYAKFSYTSLSIPSHLYNFWKIVYSASLGLCDTLPADGASNRLVFRKVLGYCV